MPQMMPLFWLSMIMSLMILLIIISTHIYFLYLPLLPKINFKMNSFENWHWKW